METQAQTKPQGQPQRKCPNDGNESYYGPIYKYNNGGKDNLNCYRCECEAIAILRKNFMEEARANSESRIKSIVDGAHPATKEFWSSQLAYQMEPGVAQLRAERLIKEWEAAEALRKLNK
jgi:hypothetical protein